ncbi:hypothetical protein [Paenibacillus sp. TC-CSREp1]|uniref:hypothetical protein n=1 Tax=Paenibacillus sp. TC-CSREp1 TaxID=3410089 RepID=UPI003CED0D03
MRAVELEDGRYVMALTPDDLRQNLSTVSTRDLQAELSRRDGVNTYFLSNEGLARITFSTGHRRDCAEVKGPAVITVSID